MALDTGVSFLMHIKLKQSSLNRTGNNSASLGMPTTSMLKLAFAILDCKCVA
jgi:hypothetical protein